MMVQEAAGSTTRRRSIMATKKAATKTAAKKTATKKK
jgi:hypothetical protein